MSGNVGPTYGTSTGADYNLDFCLKSSFRNLCHHLHILSDNRIFAFKAQIEVELVYVAYLHLNLDL